MTTEKESGLSKMERAFWACLERKPYDRISVSEVVREAGVNRNLFYYHFNDLSNLAEYAATRAVPLELAHFVLLQDAGPAEVALRIAGVGDIEERMRKLRLAVGPHGTVALVETVKGVIRHEWLRVYDLSENDIDDGTHIGMNFALGGLTSIWADRSFDSLEELQRAVANSGLVPCVIETLSERFAQLAHASQGRIEIHLRPDRCLPYHNRALNRS